MIVLSVDFKYPFHDRVESWLMLRALSEVAYEVMILGSNLGWSDVEIW